MRVQADGAVCVGAGMCVLTAPEQHAPAVLVLHPGTDDGTSWGPPSPGTVR